MECINCQEELKGKQRLFCCKICKGLYYAAHGTKPIDNNELVEIQRLYDSGLSLRQIAKQFGKWSVETLHRLSKAGKIIIRTRSDAGKISSTGKVHSEETRLKISNARKKFLKENPDMVPYKLNHKHKKESYPEKYFKECFKDKFVSQYRVGLYELDFADLKNRIDIEIDGCQHYLDTKIIEHDIVRNKFLIAEGWNIIRIRWSIFMKSNEDERQFIVNEILSNRIPDHLSIIYYPASTLVDDVTFYANINRRDESRICPSCSGDKDRVSRECCRCAAKRKIKINWPSVNEMKVKVADFSLYRIAKDLGVSDNAVRKFCIRNNIDFRKRNEHAENFEIS